MAHPLVLIFGAHSVSEGQYHWLRCVAIQVRETHADVRKVQECVEREHTERVRSEQVVVVHL